MVLVRPWIWRDQPVGFLAELPPAFGPAGMVLAFAAAVAGWARSSRRSSAICFSWFGAPRHGRSRRRGPAARAAGCSRRALRTEDARSRRDLGTLALKVLGIRIRVTGLQRALDVLQADPPELVVQGHHGRAAVRGDSWSELEHHGEPGAAAGREHPRRRRAAAGSGSPRSTDFRARELLREACFSASASSRRSRAYSVKSPRWQVIALLKPARDSSRLRTCLARPDHGAVRLELGEGGLAGSPGPGAGRTGPSG